MTSCDRIVAWINKLPEINLEYLPPTASPSPAGKRKRKAKGVQGPSPPPTIHSMEDPETPVKKRQRRETDQDTELTPRPQYEISYSRAPSLTSSSASSRTRSTSPLKKQFLELRLDEGGLETKALNVDALPNPEAISLLRVMRRIGTCKGILPDDLREEILQSHDIKQDDLDDWDSAFKDASAFQDLPGRIPAAEEIKLVCEWTTDCIESKHEEAGWNDEVHFRLLQAIFREPGKKTGGLFNITTSNTARPHKKWLPKSIGSKMVDFCVYADSSQQDVDTLKAYEDFCRTTLTRSINHTDFQRLQTHPIVLSIETKAGSNSDAAELQIGVWHAAQWAFLRSSIMQAQASNSSIEERTKEADEALSRLHFIPAIIVQGHRWLFVLSTRQGQKTILWKEWQFGSTNTIVETYQIVAGLRQLAAWADIVYLPWFHREILKT